MSKANAVVHIQLMTHADDHRRQRQDVWGQNLHPIKLGYHVTADWIFLGNEVLQSLT